MFQEVSPFIDSLFPDLHPCRRTSRTAERQGERTLVVRWWYICLSDLIDLEQLDVAASKSVAFIAADLARGNLQEQISPRWDVTREAAAQMLAVRQMRPGYSGSEWGRGRGISPPLQIVWFWRFHSMSRLHVELDD